MFKIKQVFFNFFFSLKKCIYVNAESLKVCGQSFGDFICVVICVCVCVCVHVCKCVRVCLCFKARSFQNLLGKGL